MEYTITKMGNRDIAVMHRLAAPLQSAGDFLDLMGSLPARGVVLSREMMGDAFFDLSTRIAGDIFQKAVTYDFRLAFTGDFDRYGSKSLNDFIRESNRTGHIVFGGDLAAVLSLWR
jgi:hypothetical protein